MKRGYIKLWRKIWDNSFWREKRVFSRLEAWLDMCMMASGTDKVVKNVDGQDVFLKRGQFLSSERELAKRWNWSKSKTHRFMESLQVDRGSDRPISVEVDRRYSQKMGQPKSIVTITNYGRYNSTQNKNGPAENSNSGPAEKIKSGPRIGPLFKKGLNKELPKSINKREKLGERAFLARLNDFLKGG